MARTDPQVNIRMPVDLRDRLAAAAMQNRRSLAGEVITRLEASLAMDAKASEASPGRTLTLQQLADAIAVSIADGPDRKTKKPK